MSRIIFNPVTAPTVEALAARLMEEHGLAVAPGETAAFLRGQMNAMPDHLRLPFAALTVVFALAGLVRGGLFHRLDGLARSAQMQAWRSSRIPFMRDFMKFHEGLGVLFAVSRSGLPGGEEAR